MIVAFALIALVLTGLAILLLVRPGWRAGADPLARRWLACTALALPVAVAALYLAVGSPSLIAAKPATIAVEPAAQLEQAIAMLGRKLEEQPEDAEAFALLFRALMTVQRFDEALALVQRQRQRLGESATLLAAEAEARALAADGAITAEIGALIDRALALDPANLTALWLAGYRAREAGSHAEAAALFEQASAQARDPQRRDQLARLAARSRAAAEGTGPSPATYVDVVVTVAPHLEAEVDPAATLFVYARELDGPPLPIAATRLAAALPATVRLDDDAAMVAGRELSGFASYEIVARVSASGDASPAAGDLIGQLAKVEALATAVTVTIAAVVR